VRTLATNRKLGRTTDIRNAMLRNLTTDVILHGKVETTEARAKEVKSIVDSIIALAIKEKDNYEMVDAKVVKAKLDSKGNKVTELVKSKNGKEYLRVVKEETTESRQKDMPTRLNARRKIMRKINKVKDSDGNNIDLPSKLFNEIAPKYEGRVGGYTRIVKAGPRRGDGAEVAILELI
jgi:large subunit ribosomal protein L17